MTLASACLAGQAPSIPSRTWLRPDWLPRDLTRPDDPNFEKFRITGNVVFSSDDTGHKVGNLSQQINLDVSYDFGRGGRVGGIVFEELLDGGENHRSEDGVYFNEWDAGPYWARWFEEIDADVRLGYLWQVFPEESDDESATQQAYAALTFDDRTWFGDEEAVLNPHVAWFQDLDNHAGGVLVLGVSHRFRLAEVEALSGPFWRDLSLTPSVWTETDFGQYEANRCLVSVTAGLSLDWSLRTAFDLPSAFGDPILSIFANHRDAAHTDALDDGWYGGMALSLHW